MKQKLTKWFPSTINPVREGYYEVTCPLCKTHYWDGKDWFAVKSGVRVYAVPWRGLTEEKK